MPQPNRLEVTCQSCKVASFCPSKGSSPLLRAGKLVARCRLVGGYGRVPVRPEALSQESLEVAQQNGMCLTIAEVPSLLGDGRVTYDTVKIFAPPSLHPREVKPVAPVDVTIPRSHK